MYVYVIMRWTDDFNTHEFLGGGGLGFVLFAEDDLVECRWSREVVSIEM